MHRRRRSPLVQLSAALLVGTAVVAACGSTSPGVATKSADAVTVTSPDTTDDTDTTTGTEETVVEPTSPPPTDETVATTPPTDAPTEMTNDPTAVTLPGMEVALDGPFPFDPNKPPQVYDGLMVATINDLIQYWTDTMPQVFGTEYAPLAEGVFPAYPEKTDYPANGCFSTYEEIQNNGYYCGLGDYIVWDDPGYAKSNYEDHGSGAVTGLMSHEWGHAIQFRTGVFQMNLPTPVKELQADCYSGAWFAHIARGESSLLSFTDADIRSGLVDTVLSADPVGLTPTTPGAHGAGFDRVGAFQDGFDKGPAQCATYATTFPPITEFGFTDAEQQAGNTGNLTFAELISVEPQDLNAYWQQAQPGIPTLTLVSFPDSSPPTCADPTASTQTNPAAVYCSTDQTVYVNEATGGQLLERFGDSALGYLIESAWAEAAMQSAGVTLSGEQRVLYGDCLAGTYEGNLLAAKTDPSLDRGIVSISPGDLDESIAAAIVIADDSSTADVRGDAFAKTDAFRVGVLGGFTGCNDTYSG